MHYKNLITIKMHLSIVRVQMIIKNAATECAYAKVKYALISTTEMK